MKKMLLLAAAAAFAMSATAAGPGATSAGTGAKAVKNNSPLATLYDQNSDDNGIGIVSQNFEATFDAYDAQGADDFSVPAGKIWLVTSVKTTGVYFNGAGPADSVHVTIYKNKSGKPNEAKIVADYPAVTGSFASGSFNLTIPKTKLKEGKYWVSVYANMAFGVGGEWGWETRNTTAGVGGMWKNPGGGFGTGCSNYGDQVTCLGDLGQGEDYMFALGGKEKTP
jgi:hypothetical protein